MYRRSWAPIALTLVLGCPSAPEAPPPREAAPDWASAFASRVSFDAALQAVVVDLEIAPGFHAYTVGETTGRPLAVAMAEDGAFALSGDVQYPAGTKKDLPIGPSVIVEGRAKIVAPVAKKPAHDGTQAKGDLHYQICTDEVCDRPRKKAFSVEVTAPPAP